MSVLPEGVAIFAERTHRSLPGPKMPSTGPCRLATAALAMLAMAHCADAAAAPLSSAAHTAVAAYTSSPSDDIVGLVEEASRRFAMPQGWIRAVIAMESNGDVHAVSPKGAMGLLQLMPATWAMMRDRYRLGNNPFDPHDNILAGTAYLRELYGRFGASGFLAAYNAGPARVESYLAGLRPLPGETVRYLATIGRLLPELRDSSPAMAALAAADWRQSRLFPVRSVADLGPLSSPRNVGAADTRDPSPIALAPHADGLFVAVTRTQP